MTEIVKEEINKNTRFWEDCGEKTKTEILDLLINRLGEPKNELEKNCLNAITSKVLYFYCEDKDTRGKAVFSLIGKVSEIAQTTFGTGKKYGQFYYLVKLENNTTLRAKKEDLPIEKWTQIEKLELLEQKLLFKYRKWIVHKDICDFYPIEKEQSPVETEQPPQS